MKGNETTDKTNNREIILENALHLFYLKGYDAVSVQEIVELSNITKPTLYYYFKSKSGLLQCLLEEKVNTFNKELWNEAHFDGDLIATLTRIAKLYLRVASHQKELFFFMNTLSYSSRESEMYQAVCPYIKNQFAAVHSVFDKASYQLGNMSGRQEQFAVSFIGILTQYSLYYYETDKNVEELYNDHTAYLLVHQFMHGIYS